MGSTRIRFAHGVFEVYCEGKLYGTFHLKEEAQLYAELIGSNLNMEAVRGLIRDSIEYAFGACEVLSVRVEFPYLCIHILAKGHEIEDSLPLKKGVFKSEEALAEFILSHVENILGCKLPLAGGHKEVESSTPEKAYPSTHMSARLF